MSFLVFSFYRGGGTPQTPSVIINIAPLGVRNFAQKFQKSPGYGLWLQVIQSLLIGIPIPIFALDFREISRTAEMAPQDRTRAMAIKIQQMGKMYANSQKYFPLGKSII